MLLKIVNFVILEGFVFFVVAIGAFVLSHVGLQIIGRLDAFLSRDNHSPIARSVAGGKRATGFGQVIRPSSEAKKMTRDSPGARGGEQ